MWKGSEKSLRYWLREWRRIFAMTRELEPRIRRRFRTAMMRALLGRDDMALQEIELAINSILLHQARVRNRVIEVVIVSTDLAGYKRPPKEKIRKAVRQRWDDFEAARRPLIAGAASKLIAKLPDIVQSEMDGQIPPPLGSPSSAYPEGVFARIEARIDANASATAKAAALTETHAAAIAAQHNTALELGIPISTKTWAATHDHRTRPAHRAADGQTVPVDAPFVVDGYPIPLPGDGSLGAPLSLIVNCRCGVIYDAPRE